MAKLLDWLKNFVINGEVRAQPEQRQVENRVRDRRRFRPFRDNLDPSISDSHDILKTTTNENNFGELTSLNDTAYTLESDDGTELPPYPIIDDSLRKRIHANRSPPIERRVLFPLGRYETEDEKHPSH